MARATITDWRPDDEAFWARTGRRIARRNLTWSIFAEFLGFSVWQLWSVTAVKLPDAGFDFTTGQLFWLVSLPGLVGATLRFPYTFAPARLGGRTWTVISALLLLIPSIGLAVAVTSPATPYWAFAVLAGTAGFGGGNFSSSMANISFFYPDRLKGAALGLNAAGGNIGVAVVQKLVPWAIGGGLVGGAVLGGPTGDGGGLYLQNAGLVYVPAILLAAVMAWRRMDNLAGARSSVREQARALRHKYCWIVTVLYIGAFGSFIGYSAALPLVVKTQFPGVDPLTYAFLGPLVGALSRPAGGWLSDRIGGARVTLAAFAGMSVGIPVVLIALRGGSLAAFLAAMMLLFALAGIANGSVFRMVPPLARRAAAEEAAGERALAVARREGAAVIGFSAAVAAYGGFLIPEGFKRSLEATGQIDGALCAFLGYYALCLATTWWYFVRRSFAVGWAPSLADVGA